MFRLLPYSWWVTIGLIALLLSLGTPTSYAIVQNGKIAFSSDQDGDFEIYTINQDGSNLQQLTFNTVHDSDPVWSPDGSKILYVSEHNDSLSLFVMSAEGTDLTHLVPNLVVYYGRWSPDGSKIVFVSRAPGGGKDIYTMDADGSDIINLTNNSTGSVYDLPVWAVDGIIYFTTDKDHPLRSARAVPVIDIYRMNSDGTNPTYIASGNFAITTLQVSPDGTQLLTNFANRAASTIIMMDVDGSNQVPLTDGVTQATYPTWSPDGQCIVFIRDYTNLAIMNIDGGNLQVILEGYESARYGGLTWQPVITPSSPTAPSSTPRPTNTIR